MAMLPEEGNSNTACFLFPPFQGEIKPPAMRVVVDLEKVLKSIFILRNYCHLPTIELINTAQRSLTIF
jgi:hypothetical protein